MHVPTGELLGLHLTAATFNQLFDAVLRKGGADAVHVLPGILEHVALSGERLRAGHVELAASAFAQYAVQNKLKTHLGGPA